MIGETKARIDVIVIYLCPERWSLRSFDLRINLRDRFSEEWRTLSKSWKLRNKKNRPQNQAILTIHRDSITELSRASRERNLVSIRRMTRTDGANFQIIANFPPSCYLREQHISNGYSFESLESRVAPKIATHPFDG